MERTTSTTMACLLLLLLAAYCQEGGPELGRGSEVPPEPLRAEAVPTVPRLPAKPRIVFQSPEPDCANVRPIRVGGGVQRPELLRRVEPVYPDDVRRMQIQGTAIFELIINEQGRVCTVQVLRELIPPLDGAVVDAVRQWTFRPARLRGRPVAVAYVITVQIHVQRLAQAGGTLLSL